MLSYSVKAQEKIWLDASLNHTDNKKNAAYYLISEKLDSTGYLIGIYRLNETILMTGFAFDKSGIRLNGNAKWYHENGNLESEGNYENGSKIGIWKRYDAAGNSRPDRIYSNVTMNNYIFNSALVMPSPPDEIPDLNNYLKTELVKQKAMQIVEIMPINAQFVVFRDGHIGEIKLDGKLSRNQHQIIKSIIESMPSWNPGSNGTQTINVRIDVVFDNR